MTHFKSENTKPAPDITYRYCFIEKELLSTDYTCDTK